MSSHRSPVEVRVQLKHPIIDADGHWVEYNPVFAERMRKVAGDKAADGFLASQRRIPDALKLSIAERKQRGIAMEGYWTPPVDQHARPRHGDDAAHALRPARRARHRFRRHLSRPPASASRASPTTRRDAP